MTPQQHRDYDKIAQVISYIEQHLKQQPSLEQLATHVKLDPSHLQRLFRNWAGTSPEKLLQYVSIEHAKKLLSVEQASLLKTSLKTSLSDTRRLHDLSIKIEGMTPAEYKNGGEHLVIQYHFQESPFGAILLASTPKGLCHLAFVDTPQEIALGHLVHRFPRATFVNQFEQMQKNTLMIFTTDWSNLSNIKLHLRGTPFQLKVWEALLRIPMGQLSTYARIANDIHHPKACRAVGTAISDNPIAFLIPCHRVIQSTGAFGKYRWGSTRKTAIIGWEGTYSNENNV